MKVLIGVDGSASSFEAVHQIGNLLAPAADQVALYYSPPEVKLPSSATDPGLRWQTRRALSGGILAAARNRLPLALQSGSQTIEGTKDPRRGITLAADKCHADLIVVGARGLGTVERLLLGSVSRSVAHTAQRPVWIARPRHSRAGQGFRVLLTCESPLAGKATLDALRRFTWPQSSTCRVMTVVTSLFAGHVPDWLLEQARNSDVEAFAQKWANDHVAEAAKSRANMQDLSQCLPSGLQSEEPLVIEGEPTEQILAAVARDSVDLVVVGVKRKHSVLDVIFGSTSEAVLNHAHCSVLLVPHAEEP